MSSFNNSIFIATTPYHVLLSCQRYSEGDCLLFLNDDKSINNSVNEIAKKTFGSNFIIIPSFYFFKKKPFRLFKFKKMCAGFAKQFSVEYNAIFVFNDVDPIVQWFLCKIKSQKRIIIEEGIGLYRTTFKRKKMFFKFFGKIIFGKHFQTFSRIGESAFIDEIECFHPDMLSEIQQKKHITVLNKTSYQNLAFTLHIHQIKGDCWFIGQPLVEDGIMSEFSYMEFICKLIDVLKNINKKLIIKPHPRENIQKYKNIPMGNYEVLHDNQLPVELLIDTTVNPSVFTIYSSAIMTISRVSGVRCYSLVDLINSCLISEQIKKLFLLENVLFVKDWKDLV